MDIYDCINYNPSFWDFLFPNKELLYKLCLSFDKTKLFLVSLVRITMYFILFIYLQSYSYIELDLNQTGKTMCYALLLAYIIMNILFLIIVLFKKPAIDKYELDRTSTSLALALQEEETKKHYVPPTVLSETPTSFSNNP